MKGIPNHLTGGGANYIVPELSLSSQLVFPRPTNIKIVAAIPCYNTELFIAEIISEVQKYVDEVIVVDDGSHDNTAKMAEAAGALVVSHSANKGYGEAIKSCFEAARTNGADVLVILDGDGQHNPDEIPQVLNPIFMEGADLVIGSRFLNNRHDVPKYRKFGIGLITFLWNFGSKIRVSDSQSGFRAYSKTILKNISISESGMSISIEILEKIRRMQLRIKEVPISCYYDHNSSFNINVFRHGFGVAFSVLRIRIKNGLVMLARPKESLHKEV